MYSKIKRKGFPVDAKNLPCDAEDTSSIPGPGTNIPQAATEQLSLCSSARESPAQDPMQPQMVLLNKKVKERDGEEEVEVKDRFSSCTLD